MFEGFSRVTNHKLALSVARSFKESEGDKLPATRYKSLVKSYVAFMLIPLLSLAWPVTPCHAQKTKRRFTVADEIGLAHFGDPYTVRAKAVRVSPNGLYFAVDTERGSLDSNNVEDSLRFYRSHDIENFLGHTADLHPVSPVWVVNRSGKQGPTVKDWRWLADSSGVAFVERTASGNDRLVLADLVRKLIEPLTPETMSINAYDIRDRNHYVYVVAAPPEREKIKAERQTAAIVGTGRELVELLIPGDPITARRSLHGSYLWAVAGSRRFEVIHNGAPIVPKGSVSLSPDGTSVVTTLSVPEVPPSWESLYPPPFASDPYRYRPGGFMDQYVRIKLQTGSVRPLTNAPIRNGMWADVFGSPNWSSDGQEILLPGTFVSSGGQMPSRPCVAVVDVKSDTTTCIEMLKGHRETGFEEGFHWIDEAHFTGAGKLQVAVVYRGPGDFWSVGTTEYQRTSDGSWRIVGHNTGEPDTRSNDLELAVQEGLNAPPLLVATNERSSRVIWDPNPQIKEIELGQASVYTWKDEKGKDRTGGLYKPVDYKPGLRYPLVIQTHGFLASTFEPSGAFPTAFAARALAAAGIVVLQLGVVGDCPTTTPDEGPCNAAGYEAVVEKLVAEGLVDPDKIGIIGFSRTCFYVMETLISGALHLKAASITDGVMETYVQYMVSSGDDNRFANEANSIIGAAPFGEDLQQWLKRSPGFNLDKISTPLLVVAEGPASLLFMWEPYAGLRFQNKPVDLIMLNDTQHVLTSPAARMVSQGGTVDWFRFWLQDYEDPDPVKASQYKRWSELRKMDGKK